MGALSEVIHLPEKTSRQELTAVIEKLNNESETHGVLLQLPLPSHLGNFGLEQMIHPLKDVDGLHLLNLGALLLNEQSAGQLIPCTPKGIIKLLDHYKIPVKGKKVCILGRSQIVGRPMAMLALRLNATVEICHSHTPDPKAASRNSDILISAIGKPKFVDASWCHADQVVIDVGINRDSQGKLCGDVDFASVSSVVKAITPVPGGIGKMTVLSLIDNLVEICEYKFRS